VFSFGQILFQLITGYPCCHYSVDPKESRTCTEYKFDGNSPHGLGPQEGHYCTKTIDSMTGLDRVGEKPEDWLISILGLCVKNAPEARPKIGEVLNLFQKMNRK
jgi:hypothetical protein